MSSRSALYALINAANSSNFTQVNATLGAPAPNADGGIDKNSVITLSAIPGQGYSGSVILHYDRVQLSAALDGETNELTTLTTPTSSSDLLTAFNLKYGTELEAADIVVESLPAAEVNGTILYTLQANTNSLGWLGTLALVITPPAQDLGDVVGVTELNGLTLEQLQA